MTARCTTRAPRCLPEYFLVSAQQGLAFFGEGSFAVLFAPRDAVQQLSGRSDKVNDLVLTAAPGTDIAALRRDIQNAITRTLPGTGVTITDRSEDLSYKFLYDDIKGDQAVWNIVAVLIFLGAAFAAFNLVTRVVEAQRREIGIGMALGAPRGQLAIRPLLVGIEVALLGVIGGLLVGVIVAIPFASLMRDILPLPVWKTNLQTAPFLKAAAIGFVLPVLATLYPVWRAVQVEPVEALSTASRRRRRSGRRPRAALAPVPLARPLPAATPVPEPDARAPAHPAHDAVDRRGDRGPGRRRGIGRLVHSRRRPRRRGTHDRRPGTRHGPARQLLRNERSRDRAHLRRARRRVRRPRHHARRHALATGHEERRRRASNCSTSRTRAGPRSRLADAHRRRARSCCHPRPRPTSGSDPATPCNSATRAGPVPRASSWSTAPCA